MIKNKGLILFNIGESIKFKQPYFFNLKRKEMVQL